MFVCAQCFYADLTLALSAYVRRKTVFVVLSLVILCG